MKLNKNNKSLVEQCAIYLVELDEEYKKTFGITHKEFEQLNYDEQKRLIEDCRLNNPVAYENLFGLKPNEEKKSLVEIGAEYLVSAKKVKSSNKLLALIRDTVNRNKI